MPKLFSYGTLQFEQVQLDTFGRLLVGQKAVLRCYKLGEIEITDQKVIKSSGRNIHPIIEFTGNDEDSVEGILFDLTEEELIQADSYEVDDYERKEVVFESDAVGFAYLKREKD